MAEPIQLFVFGATKGECILVRLPGGFWGMVDCYLPDINQPERSPVFDCLKSNGVNHLHFLCLTHPHVDHFRGMSKVLKSFRPDRIWLFGAASARNLFPRLVSRIQAADKLDTKTNEIEVEDAQNRSEIVEILDRIQSDCDDAKRNPRLDVRRLQLHLNLWDISGDPPIHIESIGASGGRALQYEKALENCLDIKRGCLAEKEPRVNHNMISGGLLIEYGQARIMLGGDIDQAAWEETLRTFPEERLRSNLIKVSHHGSVTGYCEGLWRKLSPARKATAIITPFSSQGLPSPKGLAHITNHAGVTLSASMGAVAMAADWDNQIPETCSRGLSADALIAFRTLFPKSTPPHDRQDGVCKVMVTADGVVNYELTGEAGILSS